jgi:hypothetical protein
MSESDAPPDIEGLSDEQLDALQERLDERAIERDTPAAPPGNEEFNPANYDSWLEDTDWLSPGGGVVDRLMHETQRVEYDDDSGQIRVTLKHGAQTHTVGFEQVQWHRKVGYQRLFDRYYSAFGETLANLDERKFGVLQEKWVHYWHSTNHYHE